MRGYLQYLSFDVPAFFRVLFARRADVVVVEPPPTTGFLVRLACAVRRTPYVYYAPDVWTHGVVSTGAPGFVASMVRRVEQVAMRGASGVIAVTDGVAERVAALVPGARVSVVPNGIDTGVFTADGPTLEDAPWGVYAGTTSEWQGAEVFVLAMPEVLDRFPDARIAFVGQGSAWSSLRRQAAEVAPDAVRFVDQVPPTVAATWLRSARTALVSLKPGQGYDFALPTKVLASAACGTPVLFAGVGAGAQLVEDERLGVAVSHDPAAVAAAMIAAFENPPQGAIRERLARWARERASAEVRAESAAEVVRSAARNRAAA
ncbi:glycosyltransferase involved in cell wall biosynthesis [Agromyces aurantiacus]|nr:glycosyltransferase involved in cell wall biosynthesis [Agromyces aurantiacus]